MCDHDRLVSCSSGLLFSFLDIRHCVFLHIFQYFCTQYMWSSSSDMSTVRCTIRTWYTEAIKGQQQHSGRLWWLNDAQFVLSVLRKYPPHNYPTSSLKQDALLLFTPNCDATIQMLQQKLKIIRLGSIFTIIYYPVLVSQCESSVSCAPCGLLLL